jgi:hypothetical protein
MRTPAGYQGILYMLPDRGYNVGGTSDYRARLNKLSVTLTPLDNPAAVPEAERQNSVVATLTDTILLTDPAGELLTGLDPGGVHAAAQDFPELPQASNGRVSIDTESLALLPDGSFFVGDEYGPYLYRFSPTGRMIAAVRPPDAFLPKRNGKVHYSSNNPGPGAQAPEPRNPEMGRQNNQGFEGLTLTPGGRFLVVALQSATSQDGGASLETRRYTRLLYYDITDPARPKLAREHVVPLPMFKDAEGRQSVAAQSELLALDETFFLLLCRDSSNGYGTGGTTSRYRSIELVDTSRATNIAGSPYDGAVPVAPNGKLAAGVVPATLTQQQHGTHQVRTAQWSTERSRQSVGEMGGHGAGAGARPGEPKRFLLVYNERQRFHYPERLSGRRPLQRRERGRGRFHDPRVPRHVAGHLQLK